MRLAVLIAFALSVLAAPAVAEERWIPTWYAAPLPSAAPDARVQDQTLRQMVRVSAGGDRIRLRLSNAYGTEPLRLDEVRLARRDTGSRTDPASDTAVTFNGKTGVTLAPGAYALSDVISLKVTDHADLAISLYVAGPTPLTTVHDIQRGGFYTAPGNQTAKAELPQVKSDIGIGNAFPWIAQVEVSGADEKAAIVAFGDSITDGFGIAPDSGQTWPDLLSRKLDAAKIRLSVINAGISGNRLLHHGQWARFGDNALARFDRDVLAQPNVAGVILYMGINDLGHAQGPGSPQYVTADDMIGAYVQMAARAKARGLKIYAATLTPFKGTSFNGYYSDEKEARRMTVNAWIRQSKLFDGLFDFDAALDDPARPGHLLPDYDVGDHLHPDADGMAAMVEAIPVKAFAWAKKLE